MQKTKILSNNVTAMDGPLVRDAAMKHCRYVIVGRKPNGTYVCPENWRLQVFSKEEKAVAHFLNWAYRKQVWNATQREMFPNLFALHLSTVQNSDFSQPCALMRNYPGLPNVMETFCPLTYSHVFNIHLTTTCSTD